MSKSQITQAELAAALQRILSGKTTRISPERRLSVKAVEEEAGLGNGSAYYYQNIISDIKKFTKKHHQNTIIDNNHIDKITSLRLKLKNEQRLKEQYRADLIKMKKCLVLMSSQHNKLSIIIQQYKDKIFHLESGMPYIHHSDDDNNI
ncbi:hypothetical protein [Aeromonas cavernicola]|uniref:Uncharacterized protein n=1 Tax=Aeromonas cavernicola TaxID=1006623 RepID=A0A2H9U6W1_9GAMM|nr:hypothetical protein [Aeromonas cavernicola]PJG59783.1 hypothetical protein CUC53_05145 [Aeromonas cavernicola]